jgi:predicted trehalose synthase
MGYFYRQEFSPADKTFLTNLMEDLNEKISSIFLENYLNQAKGYGFVPSNINHTHALLNLFIFEKAIREIRKFIQTEPESLIVPVKALQKIKNQTTV